MQALRYKNRFFNFFDFFPDYDFIDEDNRAVGSEYLESPMSDGTIEEDFEEALAREMEAGSISGSLRSPGIVLH